MDINIIHNEDCLVTMKTKIDKKSIDIVLTSPPYNMTKRKGGYADKQPRYDSYNDWQDEETYLNWTVDVFNSFDEILKSNGVILYNFSYSIENPALPYSIVCQILKNTPFTIADTIIWKKNHAIPHPASYNRLNRIFEFIYVICRKDEILTFEANKDVASVSSTGQNYYEIIDNFIVAKNNDGSNPYNKATYSTELCDKLLGIYAKDNSVVYDPFMGTGTTALSCINRNFKYIGSELSLQQIEYFNHRIQLEETKSEIEENKRRLKQEKEKERAEREAEKNKRKQKKEKNGKKSIDKSDLGRYAGELHLGEN
jgi:site-specific DNA-methyltransferase (adenine-specific)/modification methylase